MGFLGSGYEGPEGHLRAIWDMVWEGDSEVNLRSILVNLGPYSRPYLGNLIIYL